MKATRHSFSPLLVTCTRLNKTLCQLVHPLFHLSVHPLVTSIFDSGFCCFKACRDLLLPLPNRTQLRYLCIRPCLTLIPLLKIDKNYFKRSTNTTISFKEIEQESCGLSHFLGNTLLFTILKFNLTFQYSFT